MPMSRKKIGFYQNQSYLDLSFDGVRQRAHFPALCAQGITKKQIRQKKV